MLKTLILSFLFILLSLSVSAQTTTFTYQGRLTDSSVPANGTYSVRFDLFAAPTGGTALASQTVPGVAVANGIFTVTLDLGNDFDGTDRYLEITVETTVLAPRQKINSVPYAVKALYAANADTLNGISGSNFVQKTGDAMSGTLFLPPDGLRVGGDQLQAVNGRVGIGAYPTDAKLEVTESTAYGIGVIGRNSLVGNTNGVGVSGESINNPGFGTGGRFYGGGRGVSAFAFGGDYFGDAYGVYGQGLGSSGNRYGVYGESFMTGGFNAYGVYGTAQGGSQNFGVYGSVPPGNGWAGYFNGNLNVTGSLFGNGSNLTELNASNLTAGVLSNARLGVIPIANGGTGSAVQNFVDLSTSQSGIGGNKTFTGNITVGGTLNANGSSLTSLNASNLASGTLSDARLSTNVATLAGAQTFTGAKTFSAGLSGDGTGLTNLNASNITSGTLNNSRLGVIPIANGGTGSSTQNFVDISTNQTSIGGNKAFTGNVTISGTLSANGSTLTNINANNITNGTLSIGRGGTGLSSSGVAGTFLRSDGTAWISSALLASDVPDLGSSYIKNGTNPQLGSNFNISGDGVVGGKLGVGISPSSTLHVVGPAGPGVFEGTAPDAISVLQVFGGKGGSVSSPGADFNPHAGTGSSVLVQGGPGGDGPTGFAPGSGGSITLQPGPSGTAGGTSFPEFYGNVLLSPSGGKVGIGTSNPFYANRLQVNVATQNANAIYAENNFVRTTENSDSDKGIFGRSVNAPGYGIGVYFQGGYQGVYGQADATNWIGNAWGVYGQALGTAGSRYGVKGISVNTGGVEAYGVWGEASGATTNYGIYGTATGGTSYAGYFAGNEIVTGKLAVGTTSLTDTLTVAGTGTAISVVDGTVKTRLFSASSTGKGYVGTSGANSFVLRTNDTDRLTIDSSGNVSLNVLPGGGITQLCYFPAPGNFQIVSCSSSLRYKTNIANFKPGLSLLDRLRPISFNWKKGGMADVGFGAEEVEKVEPRLVTYNQQGQVEGVKYDRLTVVLVNAVKEQQTEIESQRKLIDRQQSSLRQQKDEFRKQQQQIDSLKQLICRRNHGAAACK